MTYHKIDGELDDGLSKGLPVVDDDEAASDAARTMMRSVNQITKLCDEARRVLATIPPSRSRSLAETKLDEAMMWAGRAFVESDL